MAGADGPGAPWLDGAADRHSVLSILHLVFSRCLQIGNLLITTMEESCDRGAMSDLLSGL